MDATQIVTAIMESNDRAQMNVRFRLMQYAYRLCDKHGLEPREDAFGLCAHAVWNTARSWRPDRGYHWLTFIWAYGFFHMKRLASRHDPRPGPTHPDLDSLPAPADPDYSDLYEALGRLDPATRLAVTRADLYAGHRGVSRQAACEKRKRGLDALRRKLG